MNRDKSREAMYERYAPVSPDHKPNKDRDPRRREDGDKPAAAPEKPATPPAVTPEAATSDSP
jgi:hypothetical protein